MSGLDSFCALVFFWMHTWPHNLPPTSEEFPLTLLWWAAPNLPCHSDSLKTATLICSISSSLVASFCWMNGRSLLRTASSRKPFSTSWKNKGWADEGLNFTTPLSAWDAKRTCCLKSAALIRKSCGVSFGERQTAVVSSWQTSSYIGCITFGKARFFIASKYDLSFELTNISINNLSFFISFLKPCINLAN